MKHICTGGCPLHCEWERRQEQEQDTFILHLFRTLYAFLVGEGLGEGEPLFFTLSDCWFLVTSEGGIAETLLRAWLEGKHAGSCDWETANGLLCAIRYHQEHGSNLDSRTLLAEYAVSEQGYRDWWGYNFGVQYQDR